MGFSFVKAATSIVPGVAFAGLLTSAALVAVPNPAQAVFDPAYTTTNPVGGSTTTPGPWSFGFFFDTVGSKKIDALGFSSQQGWSSGSSAYTVSLWSFTNQGSSPSDYTLLDSRTFTPGNSYDFQNGYFWQSINPVNLDDSTAGDPNYERGFVIGVDGDFSDPSITPGNVLFEGGTATFVPGIVPSTGNGYNEFPDSGSFYPIPAYGPDPAVGLDGYFNGNFSIAPVPAPLPLLGAAACFSFTRRIRKRIANASN